MIIYALANQKGGVAKTTSTVNLAIGLARAGKRVLAVDLDPQSSLTISLGYHDPDQLPHSISEILHHIINDQDFDPKQGILTHPEGIDLMPSNITLAEMEMNIFHATRREYILQSYLDLLQEDYDVVILDCSPSLGQVTLNALTCANRLIIPIQAHFLSLKGMEQLFHTIQKVKKRLNRSLEISGILVTLANLQTNFSKEILAVMQEVYGEAIHIFPQPIPSSIRVVEASAEGCSIFLHDPKGKATQAYTALVEEVLQEL
ncbi:MAG: ParA family protein [Eubacteriales bacterium]